MARSTFVSMLALTAGAAAQTAQTFNDPMTGITFQAFSDNSTGYRFGIALPENPTTDFIGQLHMPLTNGSGWVGADLGADMTNELLIVAYPSGNRVVSSFRVATAYASPPVYNGNLSLAMHPIAAGTKVTADSLTYTFVCAGCITGTALTFSADEPGDVFGWAISTDKVAQPSSPSSPLNFHETGYGDYGLNFTMAKSAKYAQWAAMAATNSTSTPASSALPGSAIPSSYASPSAAVSAIASPSSAAAAAPTGIAASAPKPKGSSCAKKQSGAASAISDAVATPAPLQEGSVGAVPEQSGAAPASLAESGAVSGAAAAPTGFPGFGGLHHHHHHHHHNGTGPAFNGTRFGEGEHRPTRFHVGGGAARPRS